MSALRLLSRIVAAVVGGYALSAGLTALSAIALAHVMARSEAVVLTAMLGFLCYLAALIWAFAERRLWTVWAVLVGGGAASLGLALWLASLTAGDMKA